jgi:hypothetical protein
MYTFTLRRDPFRLAYHFVGRQATTFCPFDLSKRNGRCLYGSTLIGPCILAFNYLPMTDLCFLQLADQKKSSRILQFLILRHPEPFCSPIGLGDLLSSEALSAVGICGLLCESYSWSRTFCKTSEKLFGVAPTFFDVLPPFFL